MNDYVKSHIDQADILLREGSLASAHFALKKVLRREPDNVNCLILSAELRLRSGKRTDSEDIANRLFELEPASFGSTQQKRLGHICFENELYSMAAQLFEWVRKKKAQDDLSLYQLGSSLRRLGEMQGAEQRLLECVRSRPDIAAPYLQLGHVFKAIGNGDRAAHYYKKYIALSATKKGTGYWCLADLKSYAFSDDEIENIKRELDLRQEDLPQLSALYFALGWAAEEKRDYSAAMKYYKQGNSIQNRLKPFHTEQYHQIVAGLKNVTAEEDPNRSDEKPFAILIVGLPRSGTTLIEQILNAHSRVQATDELPFLEKIALRLEMTGGYPRRLSALTDDERKFLRQQYINGAGAYLKQDSDYFIDKYPGNFLHIGLIKRIMPESIIIDARRDPRDIAISAYRQLFNVRNEFAASFDGIFEYYKGYLAMIEHWQSAYPNQIKTLNYEQLVSSPDEEIQALLDFCGLESEPGCFKFYRQKRAVMTPSVSQVSKPMYTSSIGQWRHYEEYVRDDMSRLASLLETDQPEAM
jgi:tetratricopeptide (TPR) repeat protein